MFSFKQFTIHQDRCAMKVGTDGVLLGAWAQGGHRILDIGTGTGLVALMMAQRFPNAQVTAIDIDTEACLQAKENVAGSPFHDRVGIENLSLQDFFKSHQTGVTFDAIVSNPPFFEDSLECPDSQRSTARHTSSLPFHTLIRTAAELLSPEGTLTIIIPTDRLKRIEEEAALACLYITHRLDIKTVERKLPKRTLLQISPLRPAATVHTTEVLTVSGNRSPWYSAITADFYL